MNSINNKAVEIAEELLAVEMLEYHNKNWFGADNKVRSQKKQRLLKELIEALVTVEKSNNPLELLGPRVEDMDL